MCVVCTVLELQTIHRFSQSLSSLLPDVLLLVVHGEGLPPRVPDARHLLGSLLHLLVLRTEIFCDQKLTESIFTSI